MQEQTPLNRPLGLTDVVVTHIRDAIVRGEYAPGQQLAEASLAASLGTSRGTVREAMRVLADLGLVSRSLHRGPVVTLMTPQRAEEVYALRALLESFAARVAVERGHVDARAMLKLAGLAEKIGEAVVTGIEGMVEADMRFHWELSALAGHELLLEHLSAIQTHSRRLLVYSDLYRPAFGEVVQRHRYLIEVLQGGDPIAVESAISNHVVEVGRTIVGRMIETGLGSAGAPKSIG
jgi:DNA-binding GntR family transcriptional regulator